MAMQQFSGIDDVLYILTDYQYAPLLFQRSELTSSEASFFASGISGLVIFVATILGLVYADKRGRQAASSTEVLGLQPLYSSSAASTPAKLSIVQLVLVVRWSSSSFMCFVVVYSVIWVISVKVLTAEIHLQ